MIIPAGKKIERLSVSQIETFDANSTWGCPSKWWFKYVAKVPEGDEDPAKQAGTDMHRRIELYMKAATRDYRSPMVRRVARGDHLQSLELSGKGYIDEVRGRAIGVEHHFDGELFAAGIPLQGYIDVLLPDEVRDWKSTSDIGRYAKTEREMADSIQMVGYAHWYFGRFPHLDTVRVTHIYFQTKGKRRSEKVSCHVDKKSTLAKWTAVEETVRVLTNTARETNSDHVPKDTTKCRMGRTGCPYLAICQPLKDVDPMNSLLDIFGASAQPAANSTPPPPAPVQTAPSLSAPVQSVTVAAPTSPASVGGTSSPATAQGPVSAASLPGVAAAEPSANGTPTQGSGATAGEGTPAVVEEKPKRGRPTKSKEAYRIARVTLRQGLKINLGNYQSAEVSVELEAEVTDGADHEAVRHTLSEQIKKALAEESAPYRNAAKQ